MKPPTVLPTIVRKFVNLNNSFMSRHRTLIMLSVKTSSSLVADSVCCYCGHMNHLSSHKRQSTNGDQMMWLN